MTLKIAQSFMKTNCLIHVATFYATKVPVVLTEDARTLAAEARCYASDSLCDYPLRYRIHYATKAMESAKGMHRFISKAVKEMTLTASQNRLVAARQQLLDAIQWARVAQNFAETAQIGITRIDTKAEEDILVSKCSQAILCRSKVLSAIEDEQLKNELRNALCSDVQELAGYVIASKYNNAGSSGAE